MSNDDTKKALEEFYNRAENTNLSYHIFKSEREALKAAIDLINLQQAEIERLNKLVVELNTNISQSINQQQKAKSEAIKEFAERLTDKAELIKVNAFDSKWAISQDEIDNIVQEMVGGENA